MQRILFTLLQAFLGCFDLLKDNYTATFVSPPLIIEEYLQFLCLSPPLNKLLDLAFVSILAEPFKEYYWRLFEICASRDKSCPLLCDIKPRFEYLDGCLFVRVRIQLFGQLSLV